MSDFQEISRLLMRTWDGRCAMFWFVAFISYFLYVLCMGLADIESIRYLFFAIVPFLVFVRFRTGSRGGRLETNVWSLLNCNLFGLLMVYLEIRK
jgi:hypothetical protein